MSGPRTSRPRLDEDDVEERATGWCRNPSDCTDPDCACLALRRGSS